MEENKDLEFNYANECDLEIHCSPFGLSGVYIKIRGTKIIGIGSTMGLIAGSSRGMIHYNDCADLRDKKYKLLVVADDNEGTLRIDFTAIEAISATKEEDIADLLSGNEKKQASPSLIFMGACPEGRPDTIEPSIGILSFEAED